MSNIDIGYEKTNTCWGEKTEKLKYVSGVSFSFFPICFRCATQFVLLVCVCGTIGAASPVRPSVAMLRQRRGPRSDLFCRCTILT